MAVHRVSAETPRASAFAITSVSDEDLIRQAYEEFVKNLFRNFYEAYTTSNSTTQEKAAEQAFQNAVKAARNARDRALAILPK
jgi:predicted lipoprotein